MSQPSPNYKNATIALIGVAIFLSAIILALVYTVTIQNTGQVGTLKVAGCQIYYDAGATQNVTSINWGTLEPNSSLNLTLYAKNLGNMPVNWTFQTANWNPQNAQSYIYVNVDFKGAQNTQPNQVIPIVITNSVLSNAPQGTSYSYNLKINATG